jgi:hypothetical protein
MLKKIALVAATIAATPALADQYFIPYQGVGPHWHPYPDYAAYVPYGLPIASYSRSIGYVAGLGYVPVRVYYIPQQVPPQQGPLYNVPPYQVVAPY